MQLLYTGASSFQAQQTDPSLSLGGYISSSIMPNNGMNSIFSDISWQGAKDRKVEVRGLILQNLLGFDVTDVIFGYQYPTDPNFTLEVAFVTVNPNTPQLIEKIPNGESSPYFATFVEANIDPSASVDNSVDIGPMANNTMIAIWFRRTILGMFTPPSFPDITTERDYWKNLADPTIDSIKSISLKIKYTFNQ